MKLYICLSIYNLFISVTKALAAQEQADFLIGSQTPNYQEFAKRIENLDCVNRVYVFDSMSYKDIISYRGRLNRLLRVAGQEKRYIEERVSIDFQMYKDEIYIYNDFDIMGHYLVGQKINYHLIEDGLNFFTYFYKYYQLPPSMYDVRHWKMRLKNFLGIGHRAWGASPYATDIEVNSLEGITVDKSKMFAVPRQELYASLTAEDKRTLYNVFCAQEVAGGSAAKKSLLLCTQPLCEDGQLASLELQRRVYADIICDYTAAGYEITIKPHPRDTVDYGPLCEQYHCLLVDRFIPTEVLNFNDQISYDLALSVTTTAIEMLQFVKERKYLGFEYLEKYKS